MGLDSRSLPEIVLDGLTHEGLEVATRADIARILPTEVQAAFEEERARATDLTAERQVTPVEFVDDDDASPEEQILHPVDSVLRGLIAQGSLETIGVDKYRVRPVRQ